MAYDYDIIVVGAGPAGLSAGYNAAAAGASVLILDRKHELGKPVRCGEAVIGNVFGDSNIKPLKKFISNKPNCMECYSSRGKKLSITLNIDGYILDRVAFEQYLGERAQKQGAKLQLKNNVIGLNKNILEITKDNGETIEKVTGKIIIAADGVESRIARWAGIDSALKPQDIAVCCQYKLGDLDLDKSKVEFYWGNKYSPQGYIWLFPKSSSTANVGIFSPGSTNKSIKSLLDKFIETRIPKNMKLRFTAGCVPQANPPKQVVKDNVLLVGDAARVAIPVTGGGIGHAMVTGNYAGRLAGEVISQNLRINELGRFETNMRSFRRKIKRAYMLKQKILKDDNVFELLFGLFLPIQYVYKFSPKFIDNYLLKSLRY